MHDGSHTEACHRRPRHEAEVPQHRVGVVELPIILFLFFSVHIKSQVIRNIDGLDRWVWSGTVGWLGVAEGPSGGHGVRCCRVFAITLALYVFASFCRGRGRRGVQFIRNKCDCQATPNNHTESRTHVRSVQLRS